MNRKEVVDAISLQEGFYTLADAARILKITPRKVSGWVRGYTRQFRDGGTYRDRPTISTDYHETGSLNFRELVELRYVKVFREANIKLKDVCDAAVRYGNQYGKYPFAQGEWSIFAHQLIDVRTQENAASGQKLFGFVRDIADQMEFGEDGLAIRWFPMGKTHLVVLDPMLLHGEPAVVGTRVSTITIYKQFLATKEKTNVARWFDLDIKAVEDAIKFEKDAGPPSKKAA